jgi:hypothetical protein
VDIKKNHLFEVNTLKNTIGNLHKELETWDKKYTEINKQGSDAGELKLSKSNKKVISQENVTK